MPFQKNICTELQRKYSYDPFFEQYFFERLITLPAEVLAFVSINHIHSQIPKYIFGYLCKGEYKGNEKGAT